MLQNGFRGPALVTNNCPAVTIRLPKFGRNNDVINKLFSDVPTCASLERPFTNSLIRSTVLSAITQRACQYEQAATRIFGAERCHEFYSRDGNSNISTSLWSKRGILQLKVHRFERAASGQTTLVRRSAATIMLKIGIVNQERATQARLRAPHDSRQRSLCIHHRRHRCSRGLRPRQQWHQIPLAGERSGRGVWLIIKPSNLPTTAAQDRLSKMASPMASQEVNLDGPMSSQPSLYGIF
jgi:hypothetical protein